MFESDENFNFDDDDIVKRRPNSEVQKRPPSDDFAPPLPLKRSRSFSAPLPVKRKFPGPAGLLLPDSFNSPVDDSSKQIPCSQRSFSRFEDDSWRRMQGDYKNLSEKFTIKWIKHKANRNELDNQKAPFLAAVIVSIEQVEGKPPTVSVVLRDLTGEIRGIMISNLYEQYSKDLVVGSVIVLRQFSVLTRGVCLTITAKNLIAIYSKNNDGIKKTVVQDTLEINESDFVNSRDEIKKQTTLIEILQNKENKTNWGPEKLGTKNGFVNNVKKFQPPLKSPRSSKEIEEKSVQIGSSQLSVRGDSQYSSIWEDALEGIDADALFNDF